MIAPQDFPTQLPASTPEAAKYGEDATNATRDLLAQRNAPERVAYGPDPGQRLDVYATGKGKSRPVLLFFHGGAWIYGYLWWCGFMARGAEEQGALFVAGTYRLAPAHRFPAQLDDVKAALAWVRANIGRYGGDAGRVVVGGHSAGGHLAALACLEERTPAGVRACFPLCAPLDIHYPDAKPGSGEDRVYQYLLPRREDDIGASPVTYVEQAKIPFHLEFGENDFERILNGNRKFIDLMKKYGKTHTVRRVAGGDHFSTHLRLADPAADWYQDLGKALHAA